VISFTVAVLGWFIVFARKIRKIIPAIEIKKINLENLILLRRGLRF